MSALNDSYFNESVVEEAALTWFEELGYAIGYDPHMAPGELTAERDSFGDVVLVARLRQAIWRLNPDVPEEAREDALRKLLHSRVLCGADWQSASRCCWPEQRRDANRPQPPHTPISRRISRSYDCETAEL